MDCSQFENLLEVLCDGSAAAADREAAGKHTRCCLQCARLLRIARGEEEILSPNGNAEFAHSVLEMTSGPACGRARELLCEALDAPVSPEQARMLERHTLHCPPCRRFATTLALLRDVLPAMAEIDPGPAFTTAVLAATRGSARRPARRRPPVRLGELWGRLVRRPLFAWEAAYAGTVLFAVIFLNPMLPIGHSSARALSALHSRAMAAAEIAPAQIATIESSIRILSDQTRTAVEAESLTVAGKLNQSVVEPVVRNVRRYATKPSR
jgi:hypothetical protein